jgi:hypothetical protein
METQNETAQEQQDEKILKPKRVRTMTEEAKKEQGDRMRKVNEVRCEKARLENEAKLEQIEREINMKALAKLEQIKKKKEQIKNAKEKKKLIALPEQKMEVAVEPAQPPPPPPSVPKDKKQRKKYKKVVVESSSSEDSMDYYDNDGSTSSESECEIVYVAKKSKSKTKDREKKLSKPDAIVKEKKPKSQVQQPVPEIPKTIIKFI